MVGQQVGYVRVSTQEQNPERAHSTSPSSFNVCGTVIARSKRNSSAGTSFGSPYPKPKASPGLGFKFTGCALANAINLDAVSPTFLGSP
jgi:hypothetical protein